MKVFDASNAGELFQSKTPSRNVKSVASTPAPAGEGVQGRSVAPTVKIDARIKSAEAGSRDGLDEKVRLSDTKKQVNDSSNLNIPSLSKNKIKYGLDDNKKIVMQLVDPESNEIIRQIPPEEQLRIAKAIDKILEEATKKSDPQGDAGVDTVI